MHAHLLAGVAHRPASAPRPAPTILVFDSGLGGLTVFAEVAKARPDARFVYAADDAGFPYGGLAEGALAERVALVLERLIERHAPDLVIVACNTASTVDVVLPHLRRRFALPIVGTVPPIKPAAALSRSGLVSILATPGTVSRAYTQSLVDAFGGACRVTLVGSPRLAELATAALAGESVRDDEVLDEIRPAFIDADDRRTDVVGLGCTHYPLLLDRFERLAPWPVTWVDPAPAVARRVLQLLGPPVPGPPPEDKGAAAVFTAGATVTAALRAALAARGLPRIAVEPLPLAAA
jgi:glutamate racemase